MEEDQKTTV